MFMLFEQVACPPLRPFGAPAGRARIACAPATCSSSETSSRMRVRAGLVRRELPLGADDSGFSPAASRFAARLAARGCKGRLRDRAAFLVDLVSGRRGTRTDQTMKASTETSAPVSSCRRSLLLPWARARPRPSPPKPPHPPDDLPARRSSRR